MRGMLFTAAGRLARGRAGKKGEGQRSWLAQMAHRHAFLLRQAGVFAVGFVLAGASLLGEMSPLAIAFLAAVPGDYLLWSATGAFCGYLLLTPLETGLTYLAAALLTVVLRWALAFRAEDRRAAWPKITACGLGVLIARVGLASAVGLAPDRLALSSSEALLTMGVCYFFTVTAAAFSQGKSLKGFSNLQLASLFICLACGLMALDGIAVLGLSVGRMAAVVFTLVAAYLGKESTGAVGGVLMALAISLSGPQMLLFMGAFPLGGLVAGLFARQNKVLCALSFGVCCTIVATFLPAQELSGGLVVEWFVGCALFLLLPGRLLGALPLGEGADSLVKSERVKRMVSYKLQSTAASLSTISHKIQTLYKRLDTLGGEDISQVYHCAADKVCKNCGLCSFCWEQQYTETCDCLNKGMEALGQQGQLSGEDLPPYFVKRCVKLAPLLQAVEEGYERYLQNRAVGRKMSYVKSGVIGQMDSLAKLLAGMGEQVESMDDVDMQSSRQIANLLTDLGFAPKDVLCTTSRQKGAKIELKLDNDLSEKQQRYISEELSDYCERNFDEGVLKKTLDGSYLTLNERPPLVLEHGVCQLAADGRCGDSFDVFSGEDGYCYCVLSDGMGTGDFAAIDSTMTCSVVSTVLRSGFDIDGSVELINSALAVKTGDEAVSTIDLMRFDCFTGEALFVKGGSPCTYLLRGGRAARLGKPSLPIGILQSVALDKSAARLKAGDLVLMVSDGAVGEDEALIAQQLALLKDREPEEIAQAICQLAKHAAGQRDDITAICFRVSAQ